METPLLIAGLGNPGSQYARNRHNAGFIVVDELHAAYKFGPWKAKFEGLLSEGSLGGRKTYLLKPQTYMNLSGESVSALGHFYKIEPSQVLVVLDDLALPLGRLRLREKGSAGGHNGLRSLIEHLGTNEIPRLRVGIGAAAGETVGHVLGRFSPAERPVVEESVERAADAVEFALSHDFPAAMNRYNQNPTT